MRVAFVRSILSLRDDKSVVFLSGDLGYNLLEPVRDAFGDHFINCGIAEQNMIGIAAGLARRSMRVFCYSISPFLYARSFEFIRNDIAFPNSQVCLVGNGGGYHYGYAGPSHHALEDCSAMISVGLKVLVPSFSDDIPSMLHRLNGPTYLRLGRNCSPESYKYPAYAPWRKLCDGKNGVWVTLGPLAGLAVEVLKDCPLEFRPSLWTCSAFELPPFSFKKEVTNRPLTVFEEHVATGGLASMLLLDAAQKGYMPSLLTHRFAVGYPSGRYGNQNFHRAECGLDASSMHYLLTEQRAKKQ